MEPGHTAVFGYLTYALQQTLAAEALLAAAAELQAEVLEVDRHGHGHARHHLDERVPVKEPQSTARE